MEFILILILYLRAPPSAAGPYFFIWLLGLKAAGWRVGWGAGWANTTCVPENSRKSQRQNIKISKKWWKLGPRETLGSLLVQGLSQDLFQYAFFADLRCFGDLWGAFGRSWGSTWRHFEPPWMPKAPLWEGFGHHLASCWSLEATSEECNKHMVILQFSLFRRSWGHHFSQNGGTRRGWW